MEFKAGDRVRVLRFNGEDVDFYGTLKYVDKCMANLFDCTIKRNDGLAVFLPSPTVVYGKAPVVAHAVAAQTQ